MQHLAPLQVQVLISYGANAHVAVSHSAHFRPRATYDWLTVDPHSGTQTEMKIFALETCRKFFENFEIFFLFRGI